jgi:hypothetical protein
MRDTHTNWWENRWQGSAEEEIGIDKATGTVRVRVDPKYYRPTEVELLLGNPTKAKEVLGWTRQVTFDVGLFLSYFCTFFSQRLPTVQALVEEMVLGDLEDVKRTKGTKASN